MHGGSLRIVATRDSKQKAQTSVSKLLKYESEKSLSDPETWINFGQDIGRKIEVVRKTMSQLSKNNRIWGYGAAGKATLWVNACQMDYLEAMVDASPLRAGKLMPGTHTPIVFPDELKANPPDYIFVTAWNYADTIKSNEEWFNGVWVTPLPDLRFF
jgi:methylation protein EvaC